MANINDYGFPFTSVSGDRQYGSAEWREYFNNIISTGVFSNVANGLAVKPQSTPNKSVYIDTGSVFIKGAIRVTSTTETINIDDNTAGNPRIDRIVARLDYSNRLIDFSVLKGTPSSSPVAPTLTQDSEFWEVSLAKINLANGYSTITSTEIIDERIWATIIGYTGIPATEKISSYTLTLSDNYLFNKCTSSSDIAITIPTNNVVSFPIGSEIVFVRYGSGAVTFIESSGVTLNSSESKKSINKQYEAATLKKIGVNEWLLIGSLA